MGVVCAPAPTGRSDCGVERIEVAMQQTPLSAAPTLSTDIVAIGAGAAGLIAGIALARTGHQVTLVGKKPPPLPGRTVALFDGSLKLLDEFGLKSALEPISAPIRAMRIIDDTGSPFRTPPNFYEAEEIGLDVFGVNVTNDAIVQALDAIAENTPGLRRVEALAVGYDFRADGVTVTLDDGRSLEAKLVVAGDGRNSGARKAADIAVAEWSYPQVAITLALRHRRPHHDVTTEYHTRTGPFTFVPMPPATDGAHRSSLVWLVRPQQAKELLALPHARLAEKIAEQARHRFGAVTIEGAIGSFPMAGMRTKTVTAPRLMLVGEACHVFPPLAAQGLNLGIRDSADAAHALEGIDISDDAQLAAALTQFEASRRADIDLRTQAVDVLNRSLISNLPPVDFLRAFGMAAVAAIGPLRRAVLREGVSPSLSRALGSLTRLTPIARR